MTISSTEPAALDDIYAPATYADGPPHQLFAELRASDPVHWVDIPRQQGYWALLKHADVDWASRRHDLFSSELGGIVVDDLGDEQLRQTRAMLLGMDPPRHRTMRKPLSQSFTLRAIGGLEARIRSVTRDILDEVAEDDVVDFVADIADHLPARVIGELLGLPQRDWIHLHGLASAATSGRAGRYGPDGASSAIAEMGVYAFELASQRRALQEPPEDLTTLILESDFGGERITETEFALLFIQIFTAANDTTVGMLAGGMLALFDNPDELAALRADPSLTASAVNEILRFANPLHYFRRTATENVELRGKQIRSGDKVAVYYTSANRDEEVFVEPHRFDIRRSPNRHIAFGIGEHYCLGVHLARLEGRVFFEEFLGRFPRVDQAGEPARKLSNFNNGLDALPVIVSRTPSR